MGLEISSIMKSFYFLLLLLLFNFKFFCCWIRDSFLGTNFTLTSIKVYIFYLISLKF